MVLLMSPSGLYVSKTFLTAFNLCWVGVLSMEMYAYASRQIVCSCTRPMDNQELFIIMYSVAIIYVYDSTWEKVLNFHYGRLITGIVHGFVT